MEFTCIYCRRSSSQVAPSKAHIFPDALGGITSQIDKVCVGCNEEVNRQIEMPLLPCFAFFRNIWGIKGRRGSIPAVPGIVKFAGQEARVSINAQGDIDHAIILPETDAQGKLIYSIFGPPDKVEARRRAVDKKKSGLSWKEMNAGHPAEITADVGEFDLLGILRRLSVKIAFEWFAYLKLDVLSSDFDAVRGFIQTGKESDTLCGVLPDPRQVRFISNLIQYPLPNHWVAVVAFPGTSVLAELSQLASIIANFSKVRARKAA